MQTQPTPVFRWQLLFNNLCKVSLNFFWLLSRTVNMTADKYSCLPKACFPTCLFLRVKPFPFSLILRLLYPTSRTMSLKFQMFIQDKNKSLNSLSLSVSNLSVLADFKSSADSPNSSQTPALSLDSMSLSFPTEYNFVVLDGPTEPGLQMTQPALPDLY